MPSVLLAQEVQVSELVSRYSLVVSHSVSVIPVPMTVCPESSTPSTAACRAQAHPLERGGLGEGGAPAKNDGWRISTTPPPFAPGGCSHAALPVTGRRQRVSTGWGLETGRS